MVAGVRVSFGLVKDEVAPALENHGKGYKASKRAIGEIQGSYKQLEREAVRALKRTADETTKLNRIQTGLNRLVERGVISQERAAQVVSRLSRPIFKAVDAQDTMTESILKTTAGYLGAQEAAQRLNEIIQQGVQIERERREASRTGADAALAFAAVQQASGLDVKAEREEVLDIARRTGANVDLNELFNAAQALQSALGEEEGRRQLETVLKGELASLPIELGKELIIQANAQGLDDKAILARSLFAAGLESGRDPATIAPAAKVFNLADDKAFASTVALAIGDVRADDIKTFTQAAFLALGTEADRRKLGLDETASQAEVLQALRQQRASLPEDATENQRFSQIKDLGIANIRQIQAVDILLNRDAQEFDDLNRRIQERAAPGVFDRVRQGIEESDPLFAERREVARQQLEFSELRSFNTEALQREAQNRARANELIREGKEINFLGQRTTTATGELEPTAAAVQAARDSAFFVPFTGLSQSASSTAAGLDILNKAISKTTELLNSSGPTTSRQQLPPREVE